MREPGNANYIFSTDILSNDDNIRNIKKGGVNNYGSSGKIKEATITGR